MKPQDAVYIDGGRIVVTNCGGTAAHIGIDAPREVVIDRKAVHLRKVRERSDPDYTRPEISR